MGPLLFCEFVNGTHGISGCLKRVVLLVTPAISTRSSLPFLLAAFLAAFFIACGRPNQERSSLPVLPVLLLLTGEHLEEVDGVKNERGGTPEVWALQGSFFGTLWKRSDL